MTSSRSFGSAPVALLLLASAFGACSSPAEPASGAAGRTSQAIIDGVPSDAEDDSTIRLRIFQDGAPYASCTGVLVADNLVLTARHCVSLTDPQFLCDETGIAVRGAQIRGDRAPSDLGVITGSTLSETLAARGVELFTLPDRTICNRDIALLRLDRPVTGVPIAQLRLKAPPAVGEAVRVVGWGLSNNATNDPRVRARRDGVTVDTLGPLTVFPLTGQGIGDHEFIVGESVCRGDSGGPAYAETTRAVIGVYSQGGNGKAPDAAGSECVDDDTHVTQNVYTRVDGFPDLFAAAFAAAGTEPWEEGSADPREPTTGEGSTETGTAPAEEVDDAAAASDGGCSLGARGRSPAAAPSGAVALAAALLLGAASASRRRRT